jgi:hypothetical protein
MIQRWPQQVPWQRLFGELAIIVVGVLLALWIEDWRQTRIDRQSEADYLDRLVIDIAADIERIDGLIRHTEMRDDNARVALAFLDSDAQTGDWTLVEALSRAGYLAFFQHHRATMDDLLSTGGLALLLDKQLLREVTGYYRASDFLIQFDQQKHEWIWIRYRDTLNRHVPHLVVAEVESTARRGDATPDLSRVDWQGLRDDPNMRAGLESVISTAALERRMLRRLQARAKAVLAALVTAGATRPTSTP